METIKKLCDAIKVISKPRKKSCDNFLKFHKELLTTIPKELRKNLVSCGNPTIGNNDYDWDISLKDYNDWRKEIKVKNLRFKPIKKLKGLVESKLISIFGEEDIEQEDLDMKDMLKLIDSIYDEKTIKKSKKKRKKRKK